MIPTHVIIDSYEVLDQHFFPNQVVDKIFQTEFELVSRRNTWIDQKSSRQLSVTGLPVPFPGRFIVSVSV